MSILAPRLHALARALRLIGRQPGAFAIAVLLCALAFSVVLAGAIAALSLAPHWPASMATRPSAPGAQLSVFIALSTSAADVKALAARIDQLPAVDTAEIVARDEALAQLLRRADNGGPALPPLRSNPLPDVIAVALRSGLSEATIEQTIGELRKLARVEQVVYDGTTQRRLRALFRTGLAIAIAIGAATLALVSVAVIGSVRLLVAADAVEAQVLRMVGATRGFVVRPYAYVGVIVLTVSLLLAAALVGAGARLLTPTLAEVGAAFGVELTLVVPAAGMVALTLIVVVASGWVLGRLAASGVADR